MEISEADDTLLNLHNSSDDTQPCPIIILYDKTLYQIKAVF